MKIIRFSGIFGIFLFFNWACKDEPLEITADSYPLTFKYEKYEKDPIYTFLITSDNKGEYKDVKSPSIKKFESNLTFFLNDLSFFEKDHIVEIVLKNDSIATFKTKVGVLYENYRYNLNNDNITISKFNIGLKLDKKNKQIYQNFYGYTPKRFNSNTPKEKDMAINFYTNKYKDINALAKALAWDLKTNDTLFIAQFSLISKLK
jgi:hypothetical protein